MRFTTQCKAATTPTQRRRQVGPPHRTASLAGHLAPFPSPPPGSQWKVLPQASLGFKHFLTDSHLSQPLCAAFTREQLLKIKSQMSSRLSRPGLNKTSHKVRKAQHTMASSTNWPILMPSCFPGRQHLELNLLLLRLLLSFWSL